MRIIIFGSIIEICVCRNCEYLFISAEVGFSGEVVKYESGIVVTGNFTQEKFNTLLEENISDVKLSSVKERIKPLANDNYFYSRFSFVADYIERVF